jgi:hypothetical protein
VEDTNFKIGGTLVLSEEGSCIGFVESSGTDWKTAKERNGGFWCVAIQVSEVNNKVDKKRV